MLVKVVFTIHPNISENSTLINEDFNIFYYYQQANSVENRTDHGKMKIIFLPLYKSMTHVCLMYCMNFW